MHWDQQFCLLFSVSHTGPITLENDWTLCMKLPFYGEAVLLGTQ